jgi:hypothetical protein
VQIETENRMGTSVRTSVLPDLADQMEVRHPAAVHLAVKNLDCVTLRGLGIRRRTLQWMYPDGVSTQLPNIRNQLGGRRRLYKLRQTNACDLHAIRESNFQSWDHDEAIVTKPPAFRGKASVSLRGDPLRVLGERDKIKSFLRQG